MFILLKWAVQSKQMRSGTLGQDICLQLRNRTTPLRGFAFRQKISYASSLNPKETVSMFNLDFINEKVRRKIFAFTPQQRIFAEYLMKHPERLAFLPIREVAAEAEVSQATVVRFCTTLGYEGYAQLSHEIQQVIQADMGSLGRFNVSRSIRRNIKQHSDSGFEGVLNLEIENLLNLAKSIKLKDFSFCVKLMSEADRICVIGCMLSRVLAYFLGDSLCRIFPNVDIITCRDARSSAVMNRLTSKSLVFLISFPRYPRETWELGTVAAGKGPKIIALTNSHVSPIVPLADLVFYIPVSLYGFVDSYSAPITFCNALITELGDQIPEHTNEMLQIYENYMQNLNLLMINKEEKTHNPERPNG